MNYIDFHCDTLSRIYYGWSTEPSETLLENKGHLDLNRMISTGYLAQFFACFLHTGSAPKTESHFQDALEMTKLLKASLSDYPDAALALSYADYKKNKAEKKASCFLTVEEGGILENDRNRLHTLYENGIRLITLTWNFENCLGYPHNMSATAGTGLKPFGIEAVKEMAHLGMLIDVSHLSDEGFRDVAKYTSIPFIASHSCCRALCGHSRNLTDEMLHQLGERQGLVGINFCGAFLQENGASTVDAMVHHLRHVINKGGLDIAALGSDFDGISGELELKGCQDMDKLSNALNLAGFSSTEVDAICYKNAERILKTVIK